MNRNWTFLYWRGADAGFPTLPGRQAVLVFRHSFPHAGQSLSACHQLDLIAMFFLLLSPPLVLCLSFLFRHQKYLSTISFFISHFYVRVTQHAVPVPVLANGTARDSWCLCLSSDRWPSFLRALPTSCRCTMATFTLPKPTPWASSSPCCRCCRSRSSWSRNWCLTKAVYWR